MSVSPPSASVAPCLRCQGTRVVSPVVVGTEDSARFVGRYDTHPDALVMKGRTEVKIVGRVCTDCGHVELVVPSAYDQAELREAHRKRGSSR